MDAWANYFLLLASAMGALAWIVSKKLWMSKNRLIVRIFANLIYSFIALTVAGAMLSFAVFLLGLGMERILTAVYANFFGAVAFFTETGWETAAFWLPIIILRAAYFTTRDLKNAKLKSSAKIA